MRRIYILERKQRLVWGTRHHQKLSLSTDILTICIDYIRIFLQILDYLKEISILS